MKRPLILTIILVMTSQFSWSQGCIMVRNISGFGQYSPTDNAFTQNNWQLNIIGRYFKAYHDYLRSEDQKTPEADQNIIQSYSTDITVTRLFEKGWSIDLSLPVSSNSRSADKEHSGAGTERYTTNTFGIGDARLVVYKWLKRPKVTQKFNAQLGLGIKFPTGNYKYEDYFYKNHDSLKVLAPVNGSIQLGDGGTGIITQFNVFYFFSKSISFYGNLYYLINPRDQNGVSTKTGGTPSAIELQTGNDVYSVPDLFAIRGGFNFAVKNFAFSLGVRDEGVPVRDLVGNSNGLRRPGYNFSIEPGILYKVKKTSFYAYVPFIVKRRINQSLPDAETSKIKGSDIIGTGGSGDYQLFIGVLFKL